MAEAPSISRARSSAWRYSTTASVLSPRSYASRADAIAFVNTASRGGPVGSGALKHPAARKRKRQGDKETRRQGEGEGALSLSLSPCLLVSLSPFTLTSHLPPQYPPAGSAPRCRCRPP